MLNSTVTRLKVSFLVVCFFSFATYAETGGFKERIIWKDIPIKLSLKVGQERVIHFPKPGFVRVGIPGKLNNTVLRTQILGSNVYWLAKQPFSSERIQVINPESGESYLFDLEASIESTSTNPVEIVSSKAALHPNDSASHYSAKQNTSQRIDYVTLTRYASQQMYAPTRLVKKIPGVNRVPIDTTMSRPLVRGLHIEATPLVQWKGGGYYVSAVKLKNLTDHAVTLDPRELRGPWLTATFQHARLQPRGHEADTTCVYLVSAQPFKL